VARLTSWGEYTPWRLLKRLSVVAVKRWKMQFRRLAFFGANRHESGFAGG
jgi:hypothetical protein